MRLSEIAPATGLEVYRDGAFESVGLTDHRRRGMLVFLDADRYLSELERNPEVTCVITRSSLADRIDERLGCALADDPQLAFLMLHNQLATETSFYGPSFPTQIAASARVHPDAHVAGESVRIGEGCLIEPKAVVLERSVLEDGVIVRAGCVIGAAGFEFLRRPDGFLPVTHAGGVLCERNVELQSNVCVVRSVFGGFTVIGRETKVAVQGKIGHHVEIGKRNLIGAGATITGSSSTGDDVWVGPMALISNGLRVGDRARVSLGAVVTRDVPADGHVTGNFAIDHDRFLQLLRSIR